MKKVGIIGSSGRLGSKLTNQLQSKYEIVGINSRSLDFDSLSECVFWIIATPPKLTVGILGELSQYLREDTVCISFVAKLSLCELRSSLGHEKVVRGMTDITGCMNATCGEGLLKTSDFLQDLFNRKSFETYQSDEKIDNFSYCLVMATVVTALNNLGNKKVSTPLLRDVNDYLAEKQGIDKESLECLNNTLRNSLSPEDILKEMQTPGGLSEHLVVFINSRQSVLSPEQMMDELRSYKST